MQLLNIILSIIFMEEQIQEGKSLGPVQGTLQLHFMKGPQCGPAAQLSPEKLGLGIT